MKIVCIGVVNVIFLLLFVVFYLWFFIYDTFKCPILIIEDSVINFLFYDGSCIDLH